MRTNAQRTDAAALPEEASHEFSPEIGAVAAERSKLLASKYRGQRLSPDEQERLGQLTARLKELLPPISLADLEVLLEMAEEAESIRADARKRRQRLGLS